MIFIFFLVSWAQWGFDSRTLCHDDVTRLERIINLSNNCRWVQGTFANSPPTSYDPILRQCRGTFECTTPYLEPDPTYRIYNAFCQMPLPPPGGICNVLTPECKSSFIAIERTQCDNIFVPLSRP